MQNQKFKPQNLILAAVLLLVVLLIGWLGLRWWNRDVVPVKTAVVVKGPIEAVVSCSGIVDAPVYNLGPKLGGKLVTLKVKEGDQVRTGATLAEFDDTTRLVAPDRGVIAKVNFEAGETVVPGSPAIVMVNYDKSWVEAQIDEIDIGSVRIGDKVKVTSDVYPDQVFEGRIYWIAPIAELRKVGGRVKPDEESYVFPCKIRFLGEHSDLKVNMSVNADITTSRKDDALLVPREALVSQDDSQTVFKIRHNRASQEKITIGIRSYSSVEATAGVAAGDILAITNVAKLKNKGRVKIER